MLMRKFISLLEQPNFVAYCTITAIVAIIVPLFFIPKAGSGGSALRDALQNSEYLMLCHLCCMTSAIPLAAEFLLDLYSQEIFSAAQLRERILILTTMIAFSVTFLTCRKLDTISEVYVSAHNIRFSVLLAVLYYAVLPEFKTKNDKLIIYGFNMLVAFSLLSRVMDTYTIYFGFSIGFSIIVAIFHGMFFVLGVFLIYRWLKIIAARQNARFVQFSRLTIDEYVSISYILPYLTQSATYFRNLSTGESNWRNRTEGSLIFQMCLVYIFYLTVILVPGRMLHIIAVTSRNLLKLKQIFVRFASHEIRSPLNVVHAGLDLLLAEVRNADPASPYVPIQRSTADFIVHMFTSSESAINILNDLLQYEHMEAGTFILDLETLKLVGLLKEKFSWGSLLAAQKGITFQVDDDTRATDIGSGAVVAAIALADEQDRSTVLEEGRSTQHAICLRLDMCRIDQVIRNLITNAMKFTPRGGNVSVRVLCKMLGPSDSYSAAANAEDHSVGVLRVEVTDSGAGLSEEEQKAVFGEFTQFNKNKLQGGGGSGLGLWISRRIIHMHKGTMGVSSRGRGFGATFFFELPLYQCDKVHSIPIRSKPRPQSGAQSRRESSDKVYVTDSGPTTSTSQNHTSERPLDLPSIQYGNYSTTNLVTDSEAPDHTEFVLPPPYPVPPVRYRVLIVDDSEINCKVLAKLIESEKVGRFANAVILTADDGTTAVQMMKDEMSAGREIHFVLMDYVMLEMNGPEAARVMRDQLQYRGLILGITGNVLAEDIQHFISNGANEVIPKPLTKAKLFNVMQHYASM